MSDGQHHARTYDLTFGLFDLLGAAPTHLAEPPMALVGKDYLPIVFRSPDDLAHAESSKLVVRHAVP